MTTLPLTAAPARGRKALAAPDGAPEKAPARKTAAA